MSFCTITSKNQMTVPPDLREGLGVKAGDKLKITRMPDGAYRIEKAVGFEALRGIAASPNPISRDEMDRLIAERRGR
jgi:AbrB family looped-hinge helix DNA binding protein